MTDPKTPQPPSADAPPSEGSPRTRRLHATTLWVPLIEKVGALLVAVVGLSFVSDQGRAIWYALLYLGIPALIIQIVRFATYRYSVTAEDLLIRSGFIFKRERRIPLARVQDLELVQPFLRRLLGLAALKITTAGAESEEATLEVLSLKEANRLREHLLALKEGRSDAASEAVTEVRAGSEILCRLSLRDLALGGLTSSFMAALGALGGTMAYFGFSDRVSFSPVEGFEDTMAKKVVDALSWVGLQGDWVVRTVDFFFDSGSLGKGILFALMGALVSIGAFLVRFYRFELSRSGEVISRSFGLFTLRRSSLAQDRIQAVMMEEGLLRRWFGLAALRADSAGDRNEVDESKKREWLVPVAEREQAWELTRAVLPGLRETEPVWRPISPLAILRGTRKGCLILVPLGLQIGLAVGWWWCLGLLPLIPLIYGLNWLWYRNTGYWVDDDFVLWRRGWFNRRILFLPIANVQNVTVTQSYFDRRLELATVVIDTAGQSNTGGGAVIRHLPHGDAVALQRRLIQRVVSTPFRW